MMKQVVVGLIKSSYQLLNFLVYIDNGFKYEKCIIILDEYFSGARIPKTLLNYVGSQDIELVDKEHFYFMEISKLKSQDVVYISAGIDLKIFISSIRYSFNLDFIKIDDGIGSYNGLKSRYTSVIRECGIISKQALFYIPWYFLCKNIERLTVSHWFKSIKPSVDSCYRKKLFCFFEKYLIQNNDFSRPISLFCTQPYIELNAINTKEYRKILEEALDISREKGLSLLILKHPADNVFDYSGFELLKSDLMFEEFMFQNERNIKTIFSINSSCLITAKNIFNKETYSITNERFIRQEKSFSKELKMLLAQSLDYKVKV